MTRTQRIAHIARKTNTRPDIITSLVTLGEIYSRNNQASPDAARAYDRIVTNCCAGIDPLS